tara:strand:- start:137 stop:2110 length:1974 start_codon:yes stop_codon:yes gene_type:complete
LTHNRITLRVLSGAWIEAEAGGLRITARKKVALLAYLALDRHSAPRDLLAGLIWGDTTDGKARASLRQALSELRNAHPVLKNALVIDRATVSLRRDALLVDIDQIVAEIEQGRLPPALRGGGETLNDILYGFECIGERFADWVQDSRKHCSDRILTALTTAAARTELRAATRLEFAETALSLDPLGETYCRYAMQLATDLGDVGKALQIYASFYARMEAELDMEPSYETQDLAAEIKLGSADASTSQTAAPKLSLASRNHGRPILAVLPLQAAGPEQIDDYLAEMLVDNLVIRITRTRDISVISRVSIRHLAERPDVAQILQRELGVRYIISGYIRRVGSSYFLNVELTKIDEGLVLWVEQFEAQASELHDAQSRIADEVVNRIVPNLHLAELRDAHLIDVVHLNAYQKLLRAQELIYTLSRKKFEDAGTQLKQIVTQWPDFAPAQVVLADWHSLRRGQGWSPDPSKDFAQLNTCLESALQLEHHNGRALAMMGHNKAIYARRHAEAELLFQEALTFAPGDAETLLWTGPNLAFSGKEQEAISRLEHARALNLDNPLGFRYDHFLAIAYFAAGEMEKAAQAGLASAMRNGLYTSNLRVTAAACAAIGQLETAGELAARVLVLEPDFRVSKLVAGHPFRDPAKRAFYGELLAAAGLPN